MTTLILLLPCNEIADRLQAEFLVHGKQILVQHQQIPLYAHHLTRQLTAPLPAVATQNLSRIISAQGAAVPGVVRGREPRRAIRVR